MLTGYVGLFLILFQQLAYINFITRKTLLKKDKQQVTTTDQNGDSSVKRLLHRRRGKNI